MKKSLSKIILSCSVLLAGYALTLPSTYAESNIVSSEMTFTDLSPSFWGYKTIQWGVQEKIITGYPDHTVKPTGYVKESEFLTMLVKGYKNTNQGLSTSSTHWAEPFYNKAREMNWLDKKEIVNKPITRGDVAKFMASSQGYHHNVDNSVQFVLNHRLASGKTEATLEGFDKGALVTRAEAVQILKNLKEKGLTTAKERPVTLSRTLVKQKPQLFPIEKRDKNGNFIFGLIDRKGKVVVQPQYKSILVPNGDQPILVSVKENEYKYINKNGSLAFPGTFSWANEFSEGLAAVTLAKGTANNREGYINESGKVVIPPSFSYPGGFSYGYVSEGYALVGLVEKGKATITYGIIDRSGKRIASVDYDISHELVGYNEGTLLMKRHIEGKGSEYYFADLNGNQVSSNTFTQVQYFSEGLAAAQLGQDEWGYVNTRGDWVIPAKYKTAQDFSEGLAAAGIQAEDGRWKYGYIDYNGNWVIEPIYDHAAPFSEGWASVEWNGEWLWINKENKRQLSDFPYQVTGSFSPFINGLSQVVLTDGKSTTQAYIDKKGKIIWKQDPYFK
ncbi:WG repeat-containing protein [Ammoniphilus sp. CFH 90114]|uniref:WG repeat-containing protein n=1 Tax=Ammoniphilus sp. CFH 90114 TaxID=2493665 RepID=UPI00100DD8D2|nr:WG repeat-containing protein [Ammoniphilus sp. CFH 90114]RXT03569.1 hypothetical protein EIZ39_23855 [Ammoniphilus sp. CFH 90114]